MPRHRTRNQEGTLRPLSHGRYQSQFYRYTLDPATGRTLRKHESTLLNEGRPLSARAANLAHRKLMDEINQRSVERDGGMTFGRFALEVFVPAKKGRWRPRTRDTNLSDLDRYILPYLGRMPLDRIELSHLLDFLAELGVDGRDLSEPVIRRCKTLVSSILQWALEDKYISGNPAGTRRYQLPICRATEREVLELHEVGRLWEAVEDVRDRLIVYCGSVGSGAAETFGLTWKTVHDEEDEENYFEIRAAALEGEFFEGQVKRRDRRRYVAMWPAMAEAFRIWRQESAPDSEQALVFPSRTGGTMWSGIFLQDHVQPIARQIGIRTLVNFQTLRRTFATWSHRGSREQLHTLQGVMGHARDSEVTGRVYIQHVDQRQRELVLGFVAEVEAATAEWKRKQQKRAEKAARRPARVLQFGGGR